MPSQEFEIIKPGTSDTLGDPDPEYAGAGDIRPMVGVVTPLPPLPDMRVYLDPTFAIERALIDVVEVTRVKRADYATDDDEFSNFRGTAAFAGFESPAFSAAFNIQQKLERLRALRANGRMNDPANESVDDTFRDILGYAACAYAMWLEEKAAASGKLASSGQDWTHDTTRGRS